MQFIIVAGTFIKYIFQVRSTDVCVQTEPADLGDDAPEVLASDFLTPFFPEPLKQAP